MPLKDTPLDQEQPVTDLRSQVRALLASQPPKQTSAPRRKKAHPLYPVGAGGAASGATVRRHASSGSRTGSGRPRSQPSSPTGITKARPPRGGSIRAGVAIPAGLPQATACAGASAVEPSHRPLHSPRQLDFTTQPWHTQFATPAAYDSQGQQPCLRAQQHTQLQAGVRQPCSEAGSEALLGFARLRIVSPATSPQGSPSQPQRARRPPTALAAQAAEAGRPAAATPSASQPGAVSQWRWQQYQHQQRQQPHEQQCPQQQQQQQQQQQPPQHGTPAVSSPPPPTLESPASSASGGGGWSVPPSPDCDAPTQQHLLQQWEAACLRQGTQSPPGLVLSPAAGIQRQAEDPPPGLVLSPSAGSSRHPGHAQQAGCARPAAAAAAGPVPPPSPFRNSQERREEIALLTEMAAQVGAWSSQEDELGAQQAQHAQRAWRQHVASQQEEWSPNEQLPGELGDTRQQQQQQQQHVLPQGQEPMQCSQAQACSQPGGWQQPQHEPRRAWADLLAGTQQGRPSSGGTVEGARKAWAAAAAAEAPPGLQDDFLPVPAARRTTSTRTGSSAGRAGAASPQPYICSLTSQELSELADPWSQPEEVAADVAAQGACDCDAQQQRQPGQQAQQPQQQWQPQPAQELPPPGLDTEGFQWQQRGQQRDADAAAAASPRPSPATRLRQQYSQQGHVGGNQWAAVGQPLWGLPPGAAGPGLQQQQQPSSPEGEQQRRARKEREAAEDELVADTCPLPHLSAVNQSFAAQRDAFAAADRLNRPVPRLCAPLVIMSAVPADQMLLVGGAGCVGSAACQLRHGSGSGGASSDGSGAAGAGHRDGAQQEADSGAGGQQQQHPAGASDFLSRCRDQALPAPGSGSYNSAPLAPLLAKRQREQEFAPDDVQQQQQEEAKRKARAEYQAALAVLREAAAAEAQRAQQRARQAHQEQQQAARQVRQAGSAAPAPGDGDGRAGQAPAAAAGSAAAAQRGEQGEEGWRQEAVRTFCVERRSRTGTYYRTFAVASYPAVWALFRRTRCEERHWYEVVREGRPAHLYFDLEYDPRINPQADGDGLVDRLLAHVAEQLRLHFSLCLDPRCVYELDSTTPVKFSRHLTLRLPGHAFATNHAMGKFVGQVLAASGDELHVVRGYKEGQPQMGPLVDTAVYTKNRHWRMSYCCKGGKDAVLKPTRRFATAPGATTSTAHVFLDTLVCNVDPRARLLQMPDPLPQHVSNSGRASGGSGGGGLAAAVVDDGGRRQVAWKRTAGDAVLAAEQLEELQRLAEAALPFVERVATQRGGAPARARTLAFCGAGATVAYSMLGPGSHYCENMGRPHTSNHVFFVADFVRGAYAQKCHDPDCARFRSGWMPLPPQLCLPQEVAAAMGLAPPPSPSASRRSGASTGAGR